MFIHFLFISKLSSFLFLFNLQVIRRKYHLQLQLRVFIILFASLSSLTSQNAWHLGNFFIISAARYTWMRISRDSRADDHHTIIPSGGMRAGDNDLHNKANKIFALTQLTHVSCLHSSIEQFKYARTRSVVSSVFYLQCWIRTKIDITDLYVNKISRLQTQLKVTHWQICSCLLLFT
jgi:hypothetical protein